MIFDHGRADPPTTLALLFGLSVTNTVATEVGEDPVVRGKPLEIWVDGTKSRQTRSQKLQRCTCSGSVVLRWAFITLSITVTVYRNRVAVSESVNYWKRPGLAHSQECDPIKS